MNKPSKLTLWIIIAIFALALTYFIVYVSVNDVDALRLRVRADSKTIGGLEELIKRKELGWVAADMEVDNLETIIASKDGLIMELQITEGVLELYKDNLEYTLTWVKYADELLTFNQIPHFDYIGQTVLSDSDWEEIEEQVEHFDYVESGEEVE